MAVSYSDAELASAIAASRSWRGVLRHLDLPDHSAGALRTARRRADGLRLDYVHFTGQRRWGDNDLAKAVSGARDWYDVLRRLGLSDGGGGSLSSVRQHAARLGLDTAHLRRAQPCGADIFDAGPHIDNLRTAGGMLAATWFVLRGYAVSWPLEPCRYDLLVETDGRVWRIQVKTTTSSDTSVSLSCSDRHGWRVYEADEIDAFFIVDARLNAYLIPLPEVAGRRMISLRKYAAFLVGERGQWLGSAAAA